MLSDLPAAESPARRRRALGWGAWVAIAGLALFALGLTMIALAFASVTPEEPGQWVPIYVALGVLLLLCLGLALRWRVAFVVALALGGYQLATTVLRYVTGNVVNVPIFELTSLAPALMVVGGLAASWRSYWQPDR